MFKAVTRALILVCLIPPAIVATAADGDLDGTFGSGGIVRLAQANNYHGTWMPTDVAVQSDGKIIVSGWTDMGFTDCFILRLNADGSLDTTFSNGNGFPAGYIAYGNCKYTTVAVRGNDAIVAAGYGVGYAATPGQINAFAADGTPITTFGSYGTYFLGPAGGDKAIEINRLVLDSGGNIFMTGSYTLSSYSNDFYVARIAADGSAATSATYTFPGASSYSDIARDIAFAADGSVYLIGTASSSAGDLDCAIAHFAYDSGSQTLQQDKTFSASSTAGVVIPVNYGGDNNDYCLAGAVQPPYADIVLGGQSTAVLTITWNLATFITQPASGLSNQRVIHNFDWDQHSGPQGGDINTVNRVLVEPYDNRVLEIGSGPDHTSNPSTGYDFGVVRFSGSSTPDTSFGSSGFALYDVGSNLNYVDGNAATSAVLWHGRLIIVGTAQDSAGGTDIVIIRLAPFDGIFRNGFDPALLVG